MARPKKSVNNDLSVEEIVGINNQEVENNNTSELDDMKAMLSSLMKQINDLKEENEKLKESNAENLEIEKDLEYVDEYVDISPSKPIRVLSLFKGGLTLKTSQDGSGKNFRFDKYGHVRAIAYGDLQDCIAVCRKLIEEGYVYICDKDVIRNNYLEDYYKRFLNKEQIDGILFFNDEDIKGMIENTTRPIQETIILSLIEKINNDEYVNRNKVDLIGKCCNPVCDIFGLALEKRVDN